mmetsp:Transcript_155821/g.499554  ORF Transcript_155821/g.499554 Transcript_155821/m.499554 type:complete len:256 (-) Transcript_155821:941-1708(-)
MSWSNALAATEVLASAAAAKAVDVEPSSGAKGAQHEPRQVRRMVRRNRASGVSGRCCPTIVGCDDDAASTAASSASGLCTERVVPAVAGRRELDEVAATAAGAAPTVVRARVRAIVANCLGCAGKKSSSQSALWIRMDSASLSGSRIAQVDRKDNSWYEICDPSNATASKNNLASPFHLSLLQAFRISSCVSVPPPSLSICRNAWRTDPKVVSAQALNDSTISALAGSMSCNVIKPRKSWSSTRQAPPTLPVKPR